jgi:hypothetical protein
VRCLRCKRNSPAAAEKFDRRDQHQVGEHAARSHNRRNARTDDVADTEKCGVILNRDRSGFERLAENLRWIFFPGLPDFLDSIVKKPDAKPRHDGFAARRGLVDNAGMPRAFRCCGARLIGSAGFEDFSACCAFRVLQKAVLRDDQCTPKRDHHQNAEKAAKRCYQHHTCEFQVEAEDQDCRHRHADAESDGFARGSGSLHDIVLQDRCIAKPEFRERPEQSDRNHSDRDRCADRQSNLQHQVKRGSPEDHSEDGSHDQGKYRQFAQPRFSRNERPERSEVRVLIGNADAIRILLLDWYSVHSTDF